MSTSVKDLAEHYRITEGKGFRLGDCQTGDTWKLKSKEKAHELMQQTLNRLHDLQEILYAQAEWSLLLVFQAMDAGGKDGTIEHVMSGVNPEGCEVHSFKAPSSEELEHDFLWRCQKRLPGRGRIGIFNRSYYEEVLVVRVHEGILKSQKLPQPLLTKHIWQERLEDIAGFERHLGRNGTVVRKFFLHVSQAEQKKRFLARLEQPEKNWKFAMGDIEERKYWPQYQKYYQDAIRQTATPDAPWYVVPADHKWFARLVVASVIVETLESLNLKFPQVNATKRRELATVKTALLRAK